MRAKENKCQDLGVAGEKVRMHPKKETEEGDGYIRIDASIDKSKGAAICWRRLSITMKRLENPTRFRGRETKNLKLCS